MFKWYRRFKFKLAKQVIIKKELLKFEYTIIDIDYVNGILKTEIRFLNSMKKSLVGYYKNPNFWKNCITQAEGYYKEGLIKTNTLLKVYKNTISKFKYLYRHNYISKTNESRYNLLNEQMNDYLINFQKFDINLFKKQELMKQKMESLSEDFE